MSKSKVQLLEEIYALCNTYVSVCDEISVLISSRASDDVYEGACDFRKNVHNQMMVVSDILGKRIPEMGTTADALKRRWVLLGSMHDRTGMYKS